MTTLVEGTQPNIAGNLVLTSVISDSPDILVATANTLSTTGIFVYSNIRTPLTNVISDSPDILVATANTLSTTGIFVYSNIRTPLTNVISDSFSRASQNTTTISTPTTRQILIR